MYLWVIKCNYYYRLYKNSGSQATQSREGTPFLEKKTVKRETKSHPRHVYPQLLLFLATSSLF